MKAFDRVNHHFIFKVLDIVGFGPYLRRAIETFYKGYTCVVRNGQRLTKEIPFTRGIRQGDPLSTMLYALSLEPVLKTVTRMADKEAFSTLKGSSAVLWSAYADDITFFLKSQESIEKILTIFNWVSNFSEAKINLNKSVAMVLNHGTAPFPMKIPLNATTKTIRILGIQFTKNQYISTAQWTNVQEKIDTFIRKNFTKLCSMNFLSRARWFNIRIWPRWLYIIKCLQPTVGQIAEMKRTAAQVIWCGSKHWLPYEMLTKNPNVGGLSLVDIQAKIDANRITAMKNILNLTTDDPQLVLAKTICNHYYEMNLGFNILNMVPTRQANFPEVYSATLVAWHKAKIYLRIHDSLVLLNLPIVESKFLLQADPPINITNAQANSVGIRTIRDLLVMEQKRTRQWSLYRSKVLKLLEDWINEQNEQVDNTVRNCSMDKLKDNLILYKEQDKTMNTFSFIFSIVTGDDLPLQDTDVKKVYTILRESTETQICCPDVATTDWIMSFKGISPPAHDNNFWRFLHGTSLTQEVIAHFRNTENPCCLLCGGFNITDEHTYNTCVRVTKLKNILKQWIDALGLSIKENQKEKLLQKPDPPELIYNYLIKAYRYVIGMTLRISRDGIHLPRDFIIRTWITTIRKHLTYMKEKKPTNEGYNKIYWEIWTYKGIIAKWEEEDIYVKNENGTYDIL